jgi:hypothetical protein
MVRLVRLTYYCIISAATRFASIKTISAERSDVYQYSCSAATAYSFSLETHTARDCGVSGVSLESIHPFCLNARVRACIMISAPTPAMMQYTMLSARTLLLRTHRTSVSAAQGAIRLFQHERSERAQKCGARGFQQHRHVLPARF